MTLHPLPIAKTTLLLGFFFLAAFVGMYMQATFWRGPAVEIVTLGDHVFRVPARNFVNRANWSVACCIPGLRQGGPGEIFEISAEEMAQIVESYQVADGELKANIIWLVQFLDEQALERWHTPGKISGDIWHQRGHMENSVVSRYGDTDFYRVQVKGDDVFWELTRMPPQPSQPPPPLRSEFWVASCSNGNNRRTETGGQASCDSWILHRNLYISFSIDGLNLHLVDEIGEALVGKLEEWRVQPAAGS